MQDFDYFVVIDWSARNKPSPKRPSRDAIWLAEAPKKGRMRTQYFRTRLQCVEYLTRRLVKWCRAGARVLVGWDFSFGFPHGLARALRLKGKLPWKSVWKHIAALVEDDAQNRNNRFEVGARLNEEIKAPSGPFWGVPVGQSGIFLGSKKDFDYPVPTRRGMLSERRSVERLFGRMQPAWKLAYTGSVGSQTLLGIPYVYQLRFKHEKLKHFSSVWPFERVGERGSAIVHAEVYPSLLALPGKDEIPDREQVRSYAKWLRERQENLQLVHLLEEPWGDDPIEQERVREHEGWVLGVAKP